LTAWESVRHFVFINVHKIVSLTIPLLSLTI